MTFIPPPAREPAAGENRRSAEARAEAFLLFANREVARAERRVAQLLDAADRAVRDSEQVTRTAAVEVKERDAHIAHLTDLLARTHASTSWKVSRPLRVAARIAQRIRAGWIGGTPGADAAPAPAELPETAQATPELSGDAQAVLRRLRGGPIAT